MDDHPPRGSARVLFNFKLLLSRFALSPPLSTTTEVQLPIPSRLVRVPFIHITIINQSINLSITILMGGNEHDNNPGILCTSQITIS